MNSHYKSASSSNTNQVTPNLPNVPTSLPSSDTNKDKTSWIDQYAQVLKENSLQINCSAIEPITIKQLSYNNGMPRVVWTEEEVDRMNTLENLQFVVVGKFSYGTPEIEEL